MSPLPEALSFPSGSPSTIAGRSDSARRRRSLALALTLLIASAPGCISYTLDRLPPVAELPAARDPALRPSVTWTYATISGSGMQEGATPELCGLNAASLSSDFSGTLLRSGRFSRVDPADDTRNADLHLDVVLSVRANDTLLIASACLVFLIPTWRTVEFDLTAEARLADGRWERYHFVDAARDVHWLPLILGMSFAPWGDAYGEVRAQLYATLLQHLAQDGFLEPPPEPATAAGS